MGVWFRSHRSDEMGRVVVGEWRSGSDSRLLGLLHRNQQAGREREAYMYGSRSIGLMTVGGEWRFL